MANISAEDVRNNEILLSAIIEHEPAPISGQIGIHALAKLADMMPHKDFVQFLNEALHHATSGTQGTPPQTQQPQQPPQSAPAQPQTQASPASDV